LAAVHGVSVAPASAASTPAPPGEGCSTANNAKSLDAQSGTAGTAGVLASHPGKTAESPQKPGVSHYPKTLDEIQFMETSVETMSLCDITRNYRLAQS
jgi:hypothetical protein